MDAARERARHCGFWPVGEGGPWASCNADYPQRVAPEATMWPWESAATGVDTYLVDSDTEDAETTSSAIDDFERRLAARQPQPTAAATTAAPPPTNSKSRVQR